MRKPVEKGVYVRKSKRTHELNVRGFDEEKKTDRVFLLKLLKEMAGDNTIFLSFFMGAIATINSEAIVHQYENPKKLYQGRLEIDIDKLDMSEKLFENRHTAFYIFDPSVTWQEFINSQNLSANTNLAATKLVCIVNLYDLDGISLIIKKNSSIELADILLHFKNQGYSIKKWRF